MGRLNHQSRGYSNARGFSRFQTIVITFLITITFTALYYMRYLEDLKIPSKLIIGVLAMCCLGYICWMLESLCKQK